MNVVVSRKTDEVCTKGESYIVYSMYNDIIEFLVNDKSCLIDRNDPDFSVLLNCSQEEIDLIKSTV